MSGRHAVRAPRAVVATRLAVGVAVTATSTLLVVDPDVATQALTRTGQAVGTLVDDVPEAVVDDAGDPVVVVPADIAELAGDEAADVVVEPGKQDAVPAPTVVSSTPTVAAQLTREVHRARVASVDTTKRATSRPATSRPAARPAKPTTPTVRPSAAVVAPKVVTPSVRKPTAKLPVVIPTVKPAAPKVVAPPVAAPKLEAATSARACSSDLNGDVAWVARAGNSIAHATGFTGAMLGKGARGTPGSDHPAGYAVDFMVGAGNNAAGDRIAAYVLAHRSELGVTYVIWQQRYNPGTGWRPMKDRGGATANHLDHVHVSFGRSQPDRAPAC